MGRGTDWEKRCSWDGLLDQKESLCDRAEKYCNPSSAGVLFGVKGEAPRCENIKGRF